MKSEIEKTKPLNSSNCQVHAMIKRRFGEVFIELDDVLTNIKDLSLYEYEWFMESMRATRLAYKVLKKSKLRKGV